MIASYRIAQTATKGRSNYLLKKSSVLNFERRKPRKYEADLSDFVNYTHENDQQHHDEPDEEDKNHDDMN